MREMYEMIFQYYLFLSFSTHVLFSLSHYSNPPTAHLRHPGRKTRTSRTTDPGSQGRASFYTFSALKTRKDTIEAVFLMAPFGRVVTVLMRVSSSSP